MRAWTASYDSVYISLFFLTWHNKTRNKDWKRWSVYIVCVFHSLCLCSAAAHYNDVIMSTMASQITSLIIVCSTVYSRRRSKKTSKLRFTGLCEGNSLVTGEFPAQRASNAENVSIWWRHHVMSQLITQCIMPADNCDTHRDHFVYAPSLWDVTL